MVKLTCQHHVVFGTCWELNSGRGIRIPHRVPLHHGPIDRRCKSGNPGSILRICHTIPDNVDLKQVNKYYSPYLRKRAARAKYHVMVTFGKSTLP